MMDHQTVLLKAGIGCFIPQFIKEDMEPIITPGYHVQAAQPVTYRLALLVLASVQHSPVDLSGVPLRQEGCLTFAIDKLEHLSKTGNRTEIIKLENRSMMDIDTFTLIM